jgi:hypothetical protein
MTHKARISGLNNLFYVLFFVLQCIIVFASFYTYEHVVEGVYYYNEGATLLGGLLTLLNICLFLFLMKRFNNKYFVLKVTCFALFSVFFTAATIRHNLDYPGILSIVFLVFGLLAVILPDQKNNTA